MSNDDRLRKTYDASHIQILDGLEAVRRRPSMYVGSTDSFGLHRLAFEVIDNAVDEILAGFGTEIEVTVNTDGSLRVSDDGRGIPVDPHPRDGRPGCEVVLTTLHAGAKFDRDTYGVSGGQLGVGLSCVNALSERLQLDVHRSGLHHRQCYRRGWPVTPVEVVGPTAERGTEICFLPDRQIFDQVTSFSTEILAERLQELAFLNAGVRLSLSDQRSGLRECYHFAGSLGRLVAHRNRRRPVLHPEPIVIEERKGDLDIRLALQWTRGYAEDLLSYVNCIRTPDRGSHVEGLHEALVQTLNGHGRRTGLLDGREDLMGALDVVEGLTCVLAIQLPEPELEGATKSRLRQDWVKAIVMSVVVAALERVFTDSPEVAAAVVGRAIETARARRAIRLAGERAHYQAASNGFDEDLYRGQFTVRSANWHESAVWITHEELLAGHAAESEAPGDARLLDVCCGSGVVGAAFRHRVGRTVGLDLTPAMAELAKTRLDEVHLGTVYDLPFPDEAFDIVVTREVLHLLPRPEVPLREVYRVLRPGGQFVFGHTLPYGLDDAAWMWRIFKKKQPLICNMFLHEDLSALLTAVGFAKIRTKDVLVWEDIDLWIETHETSPLHRQEIRKLYYNAPALVRAVHPFEVTPGGRIRDCWRWVVFSALKP